MTIKLFLADDSVTIQKIVHLAFSGEDVVIESVTRGDDALSSIRSFKPDIVLADVFMPGCSGYEVCEQIKEDRELAHTPVILLVGTFEPFDESEASRVKCNGYLTKPFDTAELIQLVYSHAGGKMMPQKSEAPVEPSAVAAVAQPSSDAPRAGLKYPGKNPMNARVRESFVGADRVLDLFDPETLSATEPGSSSASRTSETQTARASATPAGQPSEDFINLVVDRVIRRMSPDIIREVAWEVVPEISEDIIRRSLSERSKT